MAVTLTEAQTRLALIKAAYEVALKGKTVSYNGRMVGYQDLEALGKELEKWQSTVNRLEAKAAGATNPGLRVATWS